MQPDGMQSRDWQIPLMQPLPEQPKLAHSGPIHRQSPILLVRRFHLPAHWPLTQSSPAQRPFVVVGTPVITGGIAPPEVVVVGPGGKMVVPPTVVVVPPITVGTPPTIVVPPIMVV